MRKMRALIKKHHAKGFWLDEVQVPIISANEVLIKVEKAAICGTDVHIYEWDEWAQRTIPVPLVIGHEFVGSIVERGDFVTRYQVGDYVSAEGHITCGDCRYCRGGQKHLCPQTKGIGVQLSGCFAEFVKVPAENLWLVSDNIPADFAANLDPLGNAVHTALSFDLFGKDILITGAGPIGAMAAGICKMLNANHIVVTDTNDYRLEIARKMGATCVLNAKTMQIESAMKDFGIIGFDVGLEMSGNPLALKDMISNMSNGGNIALLGIMKTPAMLNFDEIVFKGLTIKGIYGRRIFETWYKMTNLIKKGFDFHPVITHRFGLSEFEEAFDIIRSGQCGKVLLSIDG